jgi:hypothetical protein
VSQLELFPTMSDPVPFKPKTVIRNAETNANCIAMLERYLEDARSGRVVAVAVAGVLADGSTMSGASDSGHVQIQLAALTILHHRMLTNIAG